MRRATVRITDGASAQDRLLFADTADITGRFAGRSLRLSGAATARQYESALRSVRFEHTGDAPAPARTVTFAVVGPQGTDRASKSLVVTPVDDAPQVRATGGAAAVDAGGPASVVDPGLAVTDPDTSTLRGARVSIVGATADDVLAAVSARGISVSKDASGALDLTGAASPADYQAVLRTVTYRSSGTGAGERRVRFEVGDASGSGSATRTVRVAAPAAQPVARDDAATVREDARDTVVDVLANDSAPGGTSLRVASVTQPLQGVVTNNGSSVSYRPFGNYCNSVHGQPTYPFTYTLATGQSATVRVGVTCVDDAPVAVDDSTTVLEDAAATRIDVLGNDSDVDRGPKTVQSVTQPAHGTVVASGTHLTYEPDAEYCTTQRGGTPEVFEYRLNGGSSASVSVEVTCVDDPPVAQDDLATVNEDAGATAIAVLANDTDVDGGPMTVVQVTQPANGTVAIADEGAGLTYEPDADYCNSDQGPPESFTYTLNGSNIATVTVSVTCVDDAPEAVDDDVTVAEDQATRLTLLDNDTDVDGGLRRIESATTPTNGTTTVSPDGEAVSYVPSPNYCNNPPGTTLDTFTYALNGGSSATVTVTVSCDDDAPVAVADSETVTEDAGPTTIRVRQNDTDADGGPLKVESTTPPANGTVAIGGNGNNVTYTPNANYCNTQTGGAPDTFTYKLNGGSVAQVSVTVTCVDDAPVAVADTATVTEDAAATVIQVRTNDIDVDSDRNINVRSATQPTNGTVTVAGNGNNVSYTPKPNYCNTQAAGVPDEFAYTLNGGSTATVSVTVTCVDDKPTAVADTATVDEDGAVSIQVLANDTDIDGGPIKIASVTSPANGTVATRNDDTVVRYTPNANYCNTQTGGTPDSFSYTLNGGSTATVSVAVTCVDDRPVAVDDTATVAEDAAATVIQVRANDTDVDSSPASITVRSATQPANGTVTVAGNGNTVSYTPRRDYCNTQTGGAPDTFTYTLNGGSTATVRVTVTCVNDAPVAVDDSETISASFTGGRSFSMFVGGSGVLINDGDVDDPLGTLVVVGCNSTQSLTCVTTRGGTLTLRQGGDYTYTAPSDGLPRGDSESFTYTIKDPGGLTSTATLTISVTD